MNKPIGYLINDKFGFKEFSPHPLTEADKRSDQRFTETPVYTQPPEQPKVGDGTPDAALAIAEHAFRAGWDARDNHMDGYSEPDVNESWKQREWSKYDSPEDIKALS